MEVLAANLSALQEVGFFQKKIRQGQGPYASVHHGTFTTIHFKRKSNGYGKTSIFFFREKKSVSLFPSTKCNFEPKFF